MKKYIHPGVGLSSLEIKRFGNVLQEWGCPELLLGREMQHPIEQNVMLSRRKAVRREIQLKHFKRFVNVIQERGCPVLPTLRRLPTL